MLPSKQDVEGSNPFSRSKHPFRIYPHTLTGITAGQVGRGLDADSAEEPVEVRVGLHTGEAVQKKGDFFGKHVNLAARIGGSATGGEILVSSLLAQLVAPSGEFTLSERPAMSLKGLDGEHVMHGVEWR